MNPPPNLPFEPLPPPLPPAQGIPSVPPPPPPPPTPPPPPVSAPLPKPSPLAAKEPEDIFSNMEKPGATGMGSRPMASTMPPMAHHASYGKIFAIVAVVLAVMASAGFAFWWFVIRTPMPVVPVITAPVPRPVPKPVPVPVPVPAPAPIPAETSTPIPTTTPNQLPAPITTPPDGVRIPLPTSVTNEPPPLEAIPTTTPAVETDTDKDGLSDRRESELGLDPMKADSDEDGVNDGDEVMKYGTNPLNRDTDRDTYEDGTEIKGGFNPRGEGKCSKPDCTL